MRVPFQIIEQSYPQAMTIRSQKDGSRNHSMELYRAGLLSSFTGS